MSKKEGSSKAPSWYERSISYINWQKNENPDLDNEELRKVCSKGYPWLPRSGWPYKAFLRAMRDTFRPVEAAQKKALKEKCPNTFDLFEGDS